MRRGGELSSTSLPVPSTATGGKAQPRSDWFTLKRLAPYLLQYKWRVLAALVFMVGAKLANVGVPMLLKELVDAMDL
jgi:ATP-binding cassette subfamily B protein